MKIRIRALGMFDGREMEVLPTVLLVPSIELAEPGEQGRRFVIDKVDEDGTLIFVDERLVSLNSSP